MKINKHNDDLYIELHREYYDLLVKMCLLYIGQNPELLHNAEDCVQEAFYRALTNREKFVSSENPVGWLFNACKNIARKEIEKKRTRDKFVPLRIDSPDTRHLSDADLPQNDPWVDQDKYQAALDKALSILSSMEMDIYRDYFLSEMSAPEIAIKYGLTEDSVRGAVRRVRNKVLKFFCFFAILLVPFWNLIGYISEGGFK